jgi:NAD(P)-dependent dehydrogenase (short-subunit alcohol dehydrogenase family)
MTALPHSIVIGGSRGIGRAIAIGLAEAGYRVSAVGRRLPTEELPTLPSLSLWMGDIREFDAFRSLLDRIMEAGGAPNHLVFCQRYRGSGDAWEGEIDTGLAATRNTVEYLKDRFSPDGDRSIVVITSVASSLVAEEQPLGYHVAKAGLDHLVRYYAVTLGRHGIRVNGIRPGTTLKPETRHHVLENAPLHDLYTSFIPLGRMGTADDVAQLATFLCSPQSAFVTGQMITVDGGASLLSQETLARKLKAL